MSSMNRVMTSVCDQHGHSITLYFVEATEKLGPELRCSKCGMSLEEIRTEAKAASAG